MLGAGAHMAASKPWILRKNRVCVFDWFYTKFVMETLFVGVLTTV